MHMLTKQTVLDHCAIKGVNIVWREPLIHPTLGSDQITRIKLSKNGVTSSLEYGGPVKMLRVMEICDSLAEMSNADIK